jgi:hypothetical protein
MNKSFLFILLLAGANGVVSAQTEAPLTRHIKTRITLQTLISPGGQRTDSMHYEVFNPAQKALVTRFYRDNRLTSVATVELDVKGQTKVMKFDNTGTLPNRTDYFYDTRGLIIRTIDHHYMRVSGVVKEYFADTTTLTYDERKNKLSSESRTSRMENAYDAQNHLIRHDSYMNKGGKYQRDSYGYKGNRLIDMQGFWFDGKLYKHIVNQYDAAGYLTESRDSTTNWLLLTHNTYNAQNLVATEVKDKTFQGKQSQTTTSFTYTAQGKVATRSIRSDDPLLGEIFVLKNSIPAAHMPPYELKETYTYDKYGNRLKITTELAGQTVKVVDFQMTYYP